jgi:CheY-like chemotaxis protein
MKSVVKYVGVVLLVEDDESSRLFMRFIFEAFGLEVDMAKDGLEALKKFNSKRYDIIFMDENMPNMGGIEATRKIIEIENSNKLEHTPIIALSGNTQESDKKRFLEAGADEHLGKPIFKDTLIKCLDKVLKIKC